MSTQILSSNIELRASERMTDASDGGGEMASTIIIDKINNLFGPISESDRVTGRVSLRQGYQHINTNTSDVYYGANCIIDKAPTDPNVSVLLFKLGEQGSERTQAKEHIEAYTTVGPRSRMHPVGTQNAGQQQILCYQRLGSPLPDVGDVYALSNELNGNVQAFKIQAIESYDETYSYLNGSNVVEFTVTALLLTITQPLSYTFPGADPTPLLPGDSWIRNTIISNSSKYYGIADLAIAANTNDQTITVAKTQEQLVPVTVSEQSIIDSKTVGTSSTVDAGSHNIAVSNFAHTTKIAATTGINYNKTLIPIPAPNTLYISYRSSGRWYILYDDGNGSIVGDSTNYGSGVLNYTTGTFSITLGSVPDIGSDIIIAWGSDIHYVQRLDVVLDLPTTKFNLNESVDAGSLTVTYLKNSVPVVATSDSGGIITGADVSGFVVQASGEGILYWTSLPDVDSQLQIDYDHTNQVTETFSTTSFTLTNTPIKPGSVEANWTDNLGTSWLGSPHSTKYIYQGTSLKEAIVLTGTGHMQMQMLDDGLTHVGPSNSINYTTGACVFTKLTSYPLVVYSQGTMTGQISQWLNTTVDVTSSTDITVTYVVNSASPTTRQVFVTFESPIIKVGNDLITDSLVPESLRFQWNDYEYRDYGNGFIYRHAMPWTTQAGVLAGSIDYSTREVTIDLYPTGSNTITVISCLTKYGDWSAGGIEGRTPGSPVREGSFYVRVNSVDGRLLEATSDVNGILDATEIQGVINQEMGTFSLVFGQWVLVANLTPEQTSAWWYDVNAIVNGEYFVPTFVIPDTLRMNMVVTTYLPLNPDELGLDPVRLPITGQVNIFTAGDRVVVHHTEYVTLPNPAVAGSTIDCGRLKIARVRLEDALGRRVPDDRMYAGQYVLFTSLTPLQQANYEYWEIRDDGTVWLPSTMDLDAGLVELSTPLDLTGYDQPLKLYHTIEDSALATSVDLSGLITLNRKLTHNFPANDTKVSSQLYWGDTWARYTNLFHQATWTGVWSDSPIGSDTNGKYQDVLYPVLVTNNGAIEERWRIVFTSTTAFTLTGERLGVIATGDIYTDLSPTNTTTSSPYLFLDYRGWGSGWSVGNVVRFNTLNNQALWAVRCVSPGIATGSADTVGLVFRGDSEPA